MATNRTGIQIAIIFGSLIACLFAINPFDKPLPNRIIGLLLIIFTIIPIVRWSRNMQAIQIPLFELYGLYIAITYGLPAFLTPPRYISGLQVFPETDLTSIVMVSISFALTSFGYFFCRFLIEKRLTSSWNFFPSQEYIDRLALFRGMPIVLIATLASRFDFLTALDNPLKAISTLVFALVLHASLRDAYKGSEKAFANFFALPFFIALQLEGVASGTLISIAFVGVVATLVFVSVRRRIPVLFILAIVVVAIYLQPLKSQVRVQTWGIQTNHLGTLDKIGIWVDAASTYSSSADVNAGALARVHEGLTRYNHLHLHSAVIERSPALYPFLEGATYFPLLTKFIPRMIWKDKPVENSGNLWAQHFNLLSYDDDVTSLNLPWITEMWANWGWSGIVACSLILGIIYGVLYRLYVERSSSNSIHFATSIAVLLPFLLPQESNFSLIAGQLLIGMITIAVLRQMLKLSINV